MTLVLLNPFVFFIVGAIALGAFAANPMLGLGALAVFVLLLADGEEEE